MINKLSIVGAFSFTSIFGAGPYGVCHADEIFLQFYPMLGYDYVNSGINKPDTRVSSNLISLWKNFIKTGNPSTDGKRVIYMIILYDLESIFHLFIA